MSALAKRTITEPAADVPEHVAAPALHVAPTRRLAATLDAAQTFRVKNVDLESCGAEDVLVEVEGCGICGSSIPVWEGRPWFEYPAAPGAPGHEGWGRVFSVGRNVQGITIGQRVTFLSQTAFANLELVAADSVVPLPPQLDDLPFPGEAIGCALNIFERAQISAGQNVAIVGAGFLGLLLVELAANVGARVFALSRRPFARELALDCGANEVFDTEDWWGSAQAIVDRTGGSGCERVIEVTGLQFAVDTATEMIGEYGKLVIAGFHQDGLRQVNLQKWNWKGIDVINAHERDPKRYIEGMRAGVEATLEGRIHPEKLLTHSFPLDRVGDGFKMMVERPDGFVKGWVRP